MKVTTAIAMALGVLLSTSPACTVHEVSTRGAQDARSLERWAQSVEEINERSKQQPAVIKLRSGPRHSVLQLNLFDESASWTESESAPVVTMPIAELSTIHFEDPKKSQRLAAGGAGGAVVGTLVAVIGIVLWSELDDFCIGDPGSPACQHKSFSPGKAVAVGISVTAAFALIGVAIGSARSSDKVYRVPRTLEAAAPEPSPPRDAGPP